MGKSMDIELRGVIKYVFLDESRGILRIMVWIFVIEVKVMNIWEIYGFFSLWEFFDGECNLYRFFIVVKVLYIN